MPTPERLPTGLRVRRAHPDDRAAARSSGVVHILRIRASIAEMMVSLSRLRDLVVDKTGSSTEPGRPGAVAAGPG